MSDPYLTTLAACLGNEYLDHADVIIAHESVSQLADLETDDGDLYNLGHQST